MEQESSIISTEEIQNKIYTVRGKQVMLDSDVAKLYNYQTKALNLAVKRNIERFPSEFCFQLTEGEMNYLRFQIETSNINNNKKGGRRYLPYVFTEQGIAMQDKQNIRQKIFFKGQIYDAYRLIANIIKKATYKIVIIDNYIDESILEMLTKKNKNVEAVLITSNKSDIKEIDIQKFNQQYPILKLAKSNKFHDRFIIIDNKELYHCGASLKDLGKKCFGINKIESKNVIETINNII